MVELKNTKTGEVINSKKQIKENLKKDNPDVTDKELDELVIKESFTVKS